MFVGIEREGERWTVKADALTAGPGHIVDDAVNVALRAAIVRLVRERDAGSDAFARPVYLMPHGVPSEGRARELAAAFHAAVEHEPWPLADAAVDVLEETLTTAAGLPAPLGEPSVRFSGGVRRVRLGPSRPCLPGHGLTPS